MQKFLVLLLFLLCWSPGETYDDYERSVRPEQLSIDEFLSSMGDLEQRDTELENFVGLLLRHYEGHLDLTSLWREYPQGTTLKFNIPADSLTTKIDLRDKPYAFFSIHSRYMNILSWEKRALVHANNRTTIMGFGLMTQTELLRLKLENMVLKGTPADSIDSVRLEYQKAKKKWEQFRATARWSD